MVTRIPSYIRIAGCAALMCSGISTVSAQDAASEYRQVLQQIADKELLIAQRQLFVQKQTEQIAFLQQQIDEVEPLKASFDDMLAKMAESTENAVKSDYPFLEIERLNRVDRLKGALRDPQLTAGQKYRIALNSLKSEVNYGFGVEGYAGERPLNEGEQVIITDYIDSTGDLLRDEDTKEVISGPERGDYLRYGRLALIYLNERATSARRYDLEAGAWVDLPASDLNDIRRAVRYSKGEAAPAVLRVPGKKSG